MFFFKICFGTPANVGDVNTKFSFFKLQRELKVASVFERTSQMDVLDRKMSLIGNIVD